MSRVLVVGDLMLDKYWHGSSDRISPEAPVPVVDLESIEGRPGGAANVALNVAALGGDCTLIGCVGADSEAGELTDLLKMAQVNLSIETIPYCNTITKTRVLSQHQQLIRVDLDQGYRVPDRRIIDAFNREIDSSEVVIFSDYGKGTLSGIEEMIGMAKAFHKPVLVDPIGQFWGKYSGATLITPNLKELEDVAVYHIDNVDELPRAAKALLKTYHIENILVTRGADGMMLVCGPNAKRDDIALIPTQAKDVYDVTGAGDTVIAAMAMEMSRGSSLEASAEYASAAAAVVVGKVGTSVATEDEVLEIIKNLPF